MNVSLRAEWGQNLVDPRFHGDQLIVRAIISLAIGSARLASAAGFQNRHPVGWRRAGCERRDQIIDIGRALDPVADGWEMWQADRCRLWG